MRRRRKSSSGEYFSSIRAFTETVSKPHRTVHAYTYYYYYYVYITITRNLIERAKSRSRPPRPPRTINTLAKRRNITLHTLYACTRVCDPVVSLSPFYAEFCIVPIQTTTTTTTRRVSQAPGFSRLSFTYTCVCVCVTVIDQS